VRRIHWELEAVRLSDTHGLNQTFHIALDMTISIRLNPEREVSNHCRHGIRRAGTRFQSVRPSNMM